MKKFKLVLLMIPLAALVSCSSSSVCDITANPAKYRDKNPIVVKGVVSDTWNLVFVKYFVLQDLNGECAVVIRQAVICANISTRALNWVGTHSNMPTRNRTGWEIIKSIQTDKAGGGKCKDGIRAARINDLIVSFNGDRMRNYGQVGVRKMDSIVAAGAQASL